MSRTPLLQETRFQRTRAAWGLAAVAAVAVCGALLYVWAPRWMAPATTADAKRRSAADASGLALDEAAHWRSIRGLLGMGYVEEAETALREHLTRWPGSERAREELQWLLFNQFRSRELERLLEGELGRRPDDSLLLVHLLMSEFRSPVPREGVGYLESIEQRQPGQQTVLRALGYCYWKLGQPDRARHCLEAALAIAPRDRLARLTAAEFLIEQGHSEPARRLLGLSGAASEMAPFEQDDRWWNLRSMLEERDGRLDEALHSIDRALSVRPFELSYVHRRGMLLQMLGRPTQAEAGFREANQLQSCQMRLTEIVLSGDLQHPTSALCRELAELCERRGRGLQALGWRLVAQRLAASGSAPVADPRLHP